MRFSISIPRADIKEVLKDVSVPLLEFHRESVNLNIIQNNFLTICFKHFFLLHIFQPGVSLGKRPEITVLLKQTTNMLGSNSYGLTYEAPKTELKYVNVFFYTLVVSKSFNNCCPFFQFYAGTV